MRKILMASAMVVLLAGCYVNPDGTVSPAPVVVARPAPVVVTQPPVVYQQPGYAPAYPQYERPNPPVVIHEHVGTYQRVEPSFPQTEPTGDQPEHIFRSYEVR